VLSRSRIRRSAILVLLLALLTGWSGQAFSLVTSGACVMSTDMSSEPTSDDQSAGLQDDSMPPCEGIALRCINSVGCVIFVGLPHTDLGALPAPPPSDRHAARFRELPGLAPEPELSPPILTV
jgi:hypothetical protein